MSSLITNERSAESSELQLRRQSLLRESLGIILKRQMQMMFPRQKKTGGWEVGTAVTLRTCTSMLKWLFELPCNHLKPICPFFSRINKAFSIVQLPLPGYFLFLTFLCKNLGDDIAFFPILMELPQVVFTHVYMPKCIQLLPCDSFDQLYVKKQLNRCT